MPATRYPIPAHTATRIEYGSCVATCEICVQRLPAEDRIVVSEMGEQ